MKLRKFYKVIFISHDQLYEIYARQVYQADLMGFITIEELCFSQRHGVVVNPVEEKLRRQFADVDRFFVPVHSIVRIEEVEHLGKPKIREAGDNIMRFPSDSFQQKTGKK